MEKLDNFSKDVSYNVVMAVFHKNEIHEFRPFYAELLEYLGKYAKIVVATVGYESEEVPRPHYHAHILVKENKKLPAQLVTSFKHQSEKKWKNNTISMKKVNKDNVKKGLKEILMYPLKEEPLSELCYGLDEDTLKMLHLEAKAEYDGKKKYLKKQREKRNREDELWAKKTKWVKDRFMDGFDVMETTIMQRVATLLIKYYIEEEDGKLPYRNKLEQEVLRYTVKNTSVSVETIMKNYYRM